MVGFRGIPKRKHNTSHLESELELVLGQNFDAAWKELKTINAKQQLKARRWQNPDIKLAA